MPYGLFRTWCAPISSSELTYPAQPCSRSKRTYTLAISYMFPIGRGLGRYSGKRSGLRERLAYPVLSSTPDPEQAFLLWSHGERQGATSHSCCLQRYQRRLAILQSFVQCLSTSASRQRQSHAAPYPYGPNVLSKSF